MYGLIGKFAQSLRWRWRCQRAVWSARERSLAALENDPGRRILVVCYGNIYRSPFVADGLRRALPNEVEVRSAGFHPKPGRAAPSRHVEISRKYGVDLSSHRSTCLGSEELQWPDLIVLMDRHNWQALTAMGVDDDRLVWLGVMDDGSVEIPDPYGQDDATIERIIERLSDCTVRLAERISASNPGLAASAK